MGTASLPLMNVTLLIAAASGLLAGLMVAALFYYGRIKGAFTARLQRQEQLLQEQAQSLQRKDYSFQRAQSEWALKESDYRHQKAQLERQLAERRERELEHRQQWREAQQQREALQSHLGDTQQELAAARERLEYLNATQRELRERDAQLAESRSQATELQTRLGQEREHFEAQLTLLQDAKKQLTGEFENLANRIFESKQQQFSNSSKTLLETTIDPLKSQLTEFRRKVEDVYDKESAERNRLAGQVVELQKQAQKIGQDAVSLAQALKGNTKSQGNWGEVVLERLLEQSGLQKGREYDTQVSYASEGGGRRAPDVIVRLPENKDIIIDAKVSLVDYEKYCNTEDPAQREQYLAQHIQSIRNHIRGLSVKDYEQLEGIRALDFVFIFVPIEAAFMLALQEDPKLYSDAYDKHIILASPTTLLAILRTVENIWRYEKQNKNAERIARDAGKLHDQFVLLLDALDTVGNHIDKTREAYETARKRLATGNGNLLRRVDNIRKLGAKTKKAIGRDKLEEADELDVLESLDDFAEEVSEESEETTREFERGD
ncbi:DNA recombination protein RmuC [Marinimicrobium locisalis]|uniref:DNA recombination protein RmuC n=1 Tax=Marinimicrobium locisalis TaxID=546022 RepID=UPI0032217E8E